MRGYLVAKAERERRDALTTNPNRCPKCGDTLDTGWECTGCGFDAALVNYSATAVSDD